MILVRFLMFKVNGLDIDLSQDFDFFNIFNVFIENINISNVLFILKYIAFSIVKFPHIILSLFFSILILLDKRLFKKVIFLYVYLLLSLSIIIFMYLSSPLNVQRHISTGSLRLMFEFSAPYLLF